MQWTNCPQKKSASHPESCLWRILPQGSFCFCNVYWSEEALVIGIWFSEGWIYQGWLNKERSLVIVCTLHVPWEESSFAGGGWYWLAVHAHFILPSFIFWVCMFFLPVYLPYNLLLYTLDVEPINPLTLIYVNKGHAPGIQPPFLSFSRVMMFLLWIILSKKKL